MARKRALHIIVYLHNVINEAELDKAWDDFFVLLALRLSSDTGSIKSADRGDV